MHHWVARPACSPREAETIRSLCRRSHEQVRLTSVAHRTAVSINACRCTRLDLIRICLIEYWRIFLELAITGDKRLWADINRWISWFVYWEVWGVESLTTNRKVLLVKARVLGKEHPVLQAHRIIHVLWLVGDKCTSAELHYNREKNSVINHKVKDIR